MTTAKTILVVDDSKLSRMIIKAHVLAARSDCTLLEAASAEQALKLTETCEQPDLITVDVNMPGMDGLELVGHIRKAWAAVPIVIMTANVQESVSRKCAELKVGFIEKPINEASIAKALALMA